MNRQARTAALAWALLGGAQGAFAIGFGPLPEAAVIGQALDLAIPVRLEAGEELRRECLSAQVSFAGNPLPAEAVRLRLEPAPPGAERRVVRLATITRVDEPFVDVRLSVGCDATVTRNFTLFADPPRPLAGPAPARAKPPAPAQVAAAPRTAAAAPSAGSTTAAPRPAPPRGQRSSDAPRLQLAPVDNDMQLAALAAAEQAAQAASAAQAAAREAQAAQAAALARVAELEAANAVLRAQAASAEQALAALRTQLHGARPQRADSSREPVLFALVVLLLAALAWLWYQRKQERDAHAWLMQELGHGADDGAITPATTTPPSAPKSSPATGKAATGRLVNPPTLPWTGSEPGSLSGQPREPEHKREVSVEELIDLEQQAEFFVVLGQDEAAIDLLMGHLRSTAGNSPLPYLKLLEIYKRRNERKEYERLRERFNRRFAAMAPDWEADLQHGRSLEDYPSVMGRLEGLWSRPQHAMEVLQSTLLRPDEGGDTRNSFELPAYRELMMLYAVARDRSEHEGGEGVDLLLPIGEGDAEGGAPSAHGPMFERLLSTSSLEAQPGVLKPLSVDVPIDEDETRPGAMQLTLPPELDEDEDKQQGRPSRPAGLPE